MVAKPDILVFDEPTTALDVTTQVECWPRFASSFASTGRAALYITHDLAVVAQMADRIMVLRRGKMVEVGDARQILQDPKEEYTRRLVRERVAGQEFVEAAAAAEARSSPSIMSLPTTRASPKSSTTSRWRFAGAIQSPWSGSRDPANRPWRGS